MLYQSTGTTPKASTDLRNPDVIAEFGEVLLKNGVLDQPALSRAVQAQQQTDDRFDLVISRLGLATEPAVLAALGAYLRIPVAEAKSFPADPVLPEILKSAFLKTNRILPIALRDDGLVIAISDPASQAVLPGISYLLDRKVDVVLASETEIERALSRLYDDMGVQSGDRDIGDDEASSRDVRQLADLGSEAPIIKLVNELIDRAAAESASDIHFEPRADCYAVRFRIDGDLYLAEQLPLALRAGVTSRIKIMARLNIAEQRLPQDGRIKTTVRGRDIDLRISTMPTIKGENIVVRLLDKSTVALDFEALGFSTAARERLDAVLHQPNGIVLVTGPTGSGKTTTLYAALLELNAPGVKIFTVEDPVEYQISGISQIQVQPKISLTFASALRSILRQDPDIILVGEMRDLETAEVAIQAALTGHLVLSTVHTNSAAATVTRLIDMGVEPYLIASTVKAITAQRLVRRLCPKCGRPADPASTSASALKGYATSLNVEKTWAFPSGRTAVGCEACRGTGFSGRTTICEILIVTERMRRAILERASEADIEDIARQEGMVRMLDDGVAKALEGVTTLDEVLAVVRSLS